MKSKAIRLLSAALALLAGVCCCNKSEGEKSLRTGENGETLYFDLCLKNPSENKSSESGDPFPHSATDGETIYSWRVPFYGDTVYDALIYFFSDRDDEITFRFVSKSYYMFDQCTLISGEKYSLGTVYVEADGKYASAADRQPLAGEDGIFGSGDDLKTLILVYKGWVY